MTTASFAVDADTQAPVAYANSAIVSPTSVAVGGSITVTFRVTDDVRLSDPSVFLKSPAPNSAYLGATFGTKVSGTEKDATYKVTFQIPTGYPAGTWQVEVAPTDSYSKPGTRVQIPFTVTGPAVDADTQAPVAYANSAIVSPTSVAVGGSITVTFRVTDDVRLSDPSVFLKSPAPNSAYLGATFGTKVSGTEKDATYKVTFQIPTGYPAGTWQVEVAPTDSYSKPGTRVQIPFTVTGPAPTPTPTPTPTPEFKTIFPSKKSTITCAKGKLTKKITAVKPKCPTGYKRK